MNLGGGRGKERSEREEAELLVMRSAYECACALAVRKGETENLDSHFKELMKIYLHPVILARRSLSKNQALLVATKFVQLLGLNRLEEFSLLARRVVQVTVEEKNCGPRSGPETDAVPVSVSVSRLLFNVEMNEDENRFIDFALTLESRLTSGSLPSALPQAALPHAFFEWSMKPLIHTLAAQQAAVLETAYDQLPSETVMKKLNLTDVNQLKDFVSRQNALVTERQQIAQALDSGASAGSFGTDPYSFNSNPFVGSYAEARPSFTRAFQDAAGPGSGGLTQMTPQAAASPSAAQLSSTISAPGASPTPQYPRVGQDRVFTSLARTSSVSSQTSASGFQPNRALSQILHGGQKQISQIQSAKPLRKFWQLSNDLKMVKFGSTENKLEKFSPQTAILRNLAYALHLESQV